MSAHLPRFLPRHTATAADEILASACWAHTAILTTLLALIQIGTMADLFINGTGFAMVAPISLIAALLLTFGMIGRAGEPVRAFWWGAGAALACIVLSLAISSHFYDFSWDGQWYHQAAILTIARNWNPVSYPMRPFVNHIELWDRHYAKGVWYVAAALYRTTGHLEWSKALNWLALSAMFSAACAACLDFGMRRLPAVVGALAIAMNPVVVSELATFLVDGVMICFLVVAASALLAMRYRSTLLLAVVFVAASILCINSKFTGLVFLCVILAGAALWCALRLRKRLGHLVLLSAVALTLGVLIWGYNPYVTNTIYRHQPFYPLFGSAQFPSLEQQGKDGLEIYETPANMVGRNRLFRFAYAIFGRPGNQPAYIGKTAHLMWPGTATRQDLYAYTFHETRIAGFGPLFSLALVLAVLLGGSMLLIRGPQRIALLALTGMVLASLLVSRHLWWPRYGPQLWLIAIFPALLAFVGTSPARKAVAYTLLLLLLLDASIVAGIRLRWELRATRTLKTQLNAMRDSGKVYDVSTFYFDEVWRTRLDRARVRYRDTGMLELPNGQDLMSVVEHNPASVRYQIHR